MIYLSRFLTFLKINNQVVSTILLVKVAIFAITIFAFFLLPFGVQYYYPNFVYLPHEKISLQTAFKTWDAQHYLYISERGYHASSVSNAFPPLFPFLIFIGTMVTRNSFWSGIILSNLLSFVAFYLFYVLVKTQTNEKVAYRSLIALLVFPTSFYFSFIYTESLFFFLVILFFLLLQKRKLFLASVIGFFLPLARLIGFAIFLPFLASFVLEYHKHSLQDQVTDIGKTLLHKKTLFLFSPILGLLVSMVLMQIFTGNMFAQFIALQSFVSHHSVFSIFNPLSFLKEFFTFPLAIHGFTNSLLDRFFFILFVCFLPIMFKRVSFPFFTYVLVFGFLPVLSGSFMSYMRYLVVVFPLFITMGILSTEKKYNPFVFGILFFSVVLQSLFLIMHTLNYWVA